MSSVDPGANPARTAADGFVVGGPLRGQGAVVDRILHALPDWFEIESSILEYVEEAGELATFVAMPAAAGTEKAGDAIGFLTVKPTSECALELHVMGVLQAWHRRGVGRALVDAAAAYARGQGNEILHVKTLAPSHPDPGYALTRTFYLAMGFRPLEEIPEIWGPENPCLLLVRAL